MRGVCLCLLALTAAPAAIVSSATGNTLAGGTITATWDDNTSQTFSIAVLGNAIASGRVQQPGAFNFDISDSTLDNRWSITNNRTPNLVSFVINLTNAVNNGQAAIFDSGATPGALGSSNNVASMFSIPDGIRAVSGGTISSYAFTSQYTGDGGVNMFRVLSVSLGNGVAQNGTFVFNADSDLITNPVPEGNLLLPTLALLAVGLWRRRR
jgi:hypothetical protein